MIWCGATILWEPFDNTTSLLLTSLTFVASFPFKGALYVKPCLDQDFFLFFLFLPPAPAPVSAVPSAVQMASLVSEDPHHQTPHTPDTVAPTDLNETATELADWLVLITQMLKSNIVTVGDTQEIRTTMGRLQVRNWLFVCFFMCAIHFFF